MLHIKFDIDWPRGYMKKMFEYHIHVYSPGAGADNPLLPSFLHKHKFSVHLPIPGQFSAIK